MAPGCGWEVQRRNLMGFFLLHLCRTRIPALGLACPCVCLSCTGGGSRLGILAVPAKQSSVTLGMRLWGREVDSLFGVTPSLPFLLPPALLVPSLSNWKEISGAGARGPRVSGGRRKGWGGREGELKPSWNNGGGCRGYVACMLPPSRTSARILMVAPAARL